MKKILIGIMAVVVLVVFSVPSFAGEKDEKKKDKKGGGYTDIVR